MLKQIIYKGTPCLVFDDPPQAQTEVPKDTRMDTMDRKQLKYVSWLYFRAAQAVRRKYGRNAAYRREWLDGAWTYQRFARSIQ